MSLSAVESKGRERSGSVKAEAERTACFRASKAVWTTDLGSRGSKRSPWVAWCRSWARRAKLGIQRHRYPAKPQKDRISVFDVGSDLGRYKGLSISSYMSLCWGQENSKIGDLRKGKLSLNRGY